MSRKSLVAFTAAFGFFAPLWINAAQAASTLSLYWPGWGFLVTASVEVDGKHRGWISPGKQLRISVTPGTHKIAVREPLALFPPSISVSLRDGETRFARVGRDLIAMGFNSIGPMPVMGMNIQSVSQAQAQAEMGGAKKKPKLR
jgi:hypothetical protein